MNKLEPFQVEGVKFQTSQYHSLLADDMGLGKTVQSIASFNKLKARKILIVCLHSVKYQWKTMIEEWADRSYSIQIVNTRSDLIKPGTDIIILNYELILGDYIFDQLKKLKFAVGVCDEAHYLQKLTSQRSKRILGKGGILENCVYKFMLSGTPMAGRPIDLFPMLYTLANDALAPYNTYETFAKRFCGAYSDGWGGLVARGATNLEDLRDRLKSFMLRRTDVGNLPDVVYDLIPFEPNETVKEFMSLEHTLSDEAIREYSDIHNLGEMASLRQSVAVAKLPECIEFIKDTMNTVDKLVVFYYHRKVGETLVTSLHDYKTEWIRGGVSSTFKEASVKEFSSYKGKTVLVAQLQAAGEGIDGLQTVCNHAIFVESSWIPKDILQAVGRLRRKGSMGKPIVAQFLAATGTIEYQILNSMIRKRQIIREVIG